jgi:hypothetical protein
LCDIFLLKKMQRLRSLLIDRTALTPTRLHCAHRPLLSTDVGERLCAVIQNQRRCRRLHSTVTTPNRFEPSAPTTAPQTPQQPPQPTIPRKDHIDLTANSPRAAGFFSATVERLDALTPDVTLVRLRVQGRVSPDGRTPAPASASDAFQFSSGQWIDLHIPGVDKVGGFSIVSAPLANPDERGPGTSAAAQDASRLLCAQLDTCALPCFDLAVKRAAHPPAAWVHGALRSPHTQPQVEGRSGAWVGAPVVVRVGGAFTLQSILDGSHAPNRADLAAASGVPVSPPVAATENGGEESNTVHMSGGGRSHLGSQSRKASEPPNTRAAAGGVGSLVFIAGGVGINPLVSHLIDLAGRTAVAEATRRANAAAPGLPRRLVFVYSAKTRSQMLFLPMLTKLATAPWSPLAGKLSLRLVLTGHFPSDAPDGNDPVAEGAVSLSRGRISRRYIAELLEAEAAALRKDSPDADSESGQVAVAICGPPSMTDSIVEAVRAQGLPAKNIHFERWW